MKTFHIIKLEWGEDEGAMTLQEAVRLVDEKAKVGWKLPSLFLLKFAVKDGVPGFKDNPYSYWTIHGTRERPLACVVDIRTGKSFESNVDEKHRVRLVRVCE